MRPKELVEEWVAAFNKGDAELISSFYSESAINHQVANEPIEGKKLIYITAIPPASSLPPLVPRPATKRKKIKHSLTEYQTAFEFGA